jgi:hypothetical protein
MFALITKEGGSLLLEDMSDDDDEILGATSDQGMPMMCDNRISIDSSSDNVVVFDFDPFGGIAALQGYRLVWAKKVSLAAICLVAGSASFGLQEN